MPEVRFKFCISVCYLRLLPIRAGRFGLILQSFDVILSHAVNFDNDGFERVDIESFIFQNRQISIFHIIDIFFILFFLFVKKLNLFGQQFLHLSWFAQDGSDVLRLFDF